MATVDGQPIDVGSILFVAVGGESHVGGGRISNGEYEALVPPGEMVVSIAGYMITGQEQLKDSVTGEVSTHDKLERITPRVYEFESPLRVTIERSGEVHNFDVKSDLEAKN